MGGFKSGSVDSWDEENETSEPDEETDPRRTIR